MKINVKISNFICFILIFPYMEPLLFKESAYAVIDDIYTIGRVVSLLCAIYLNIKDRASIKFDYYKSILLILVFFAINFISTILHGGDIVRFSGTAVNSISLILLTVYYYPKLKMDYLKQYIYILSILSFINFLCVIVYPHGIFINLNWTPIYFLGMDNRFVFVGLPYLFFVTIYELKTKQKLTINWIIAVFISVFPLIYLWSVGALVGMLIFVILIIFYNKKFWKHINYDVFLIVILALNILIVFFNIQNYFTDFVVGILKKDITLSGRTFLWADVLEIVKRYPLLGWGTQSAYTLGQHFYGKGGHPHNLFLNHLLETGIIGVSVYLLFVFEFIKETKKIKNIKIKFVINMSIFILFLLSVFDTLNDGIFYVIFIIGILYNKVEEDEEKNRYINIS